MRTRATAATGAVLLAGCLAAACAPSGPTVVGQPSGKPTGSKVATAVTATPSPPAHPAMTLPLTGLAASHGNQDGRVVAVSLIGIAGQAAHSGLNLAETVYVEYSDNLRLLALYQSVAAGGIGPVAPTRPADGPILGILHPIYANSGGPTGFVSTLDQSAVTDVSTARVPAAFVATGGAFYTSTAALHKAVTATQTPPPLFTFATPGEALGSGAQAAHTFTVTVPGKTAVQWRWLGGVLGWTSSAPIYAAGHPSTIIVQEVPYLPVQLHHPGGAYVPSAKVYGHGTATVASGPSVVKGLWSKPGNDAITVFSDATGVPLKLRPGATWVLLVPAATQVSST